MSTYEELKGLKVKYLSSDTSGDRIQEGEVFYNSTDFNLKSFVSTAAAHSASSMITARRTGSSFGTQTANVAAGGWVPPFSAKTEEYDGSGWANGEDLPAGVAWQFGAGTLTAGLVYGGSTDSTGQEGIVTTLEYDGTDYSSGGDLNQKRWSSTAGAGTQTAALCSSGYNDGNVTNTEEYNGSAWTAGEAIDAGKRDFGQCGTLTASILFGGAPGLATTELYDGTDYSAGPNMNTGRANIAASGTQTAALGMGGYKDPGYANNVEQYDGTSWSELSANLATARDGSFGSRGGTATAALIASGSTPSLTTATEEFTISLSATTAAAWASGGNLTTARRAMTGGAGTQTAGMIAGGYATNFSNATEEYDGSSWTNGGNYPASKYYATIGGTQTAGFGIGGGDPVVAEGCEYNGSSWTDIGNAPVSVKMGERAGIQTAALVAGGNNASNNPTAEAFTYDGSSFSNITDMPSVRGSGHAGGGSQTAAVMSSGYTTGSPGYVSTTIEWNGSAWGAGGDFLYPGQSFMNSNNTSGYDQIGAGGYLSSTSAITNLVSRYDGTSWFTSPSIATSRQQGAGFGTQTAGAIAGGTTGSATNATEEFTGETTATRDPKTIDFD